MKMPLRSGKEIIKALAKNGFAVVRQKSSHVHMTKPTKERMLHVTVPVHGNKDINPFVLKSIARQAGLTTEELSKILE